MVCWSRGACTNNFAAAALQNELCILEVIHCLVETLDRFFSNVCELDLMFNLEMVRSHVPAATASF